VKRIDKRILDVSVRIRRAVDVVVALALCVAELVRSLRAEYGGIFPSFVSGRLPSSVS
jgi:hypothetical protein